MCSSTRSLSRSPTRPLSNHSIPDMTADASDSEELEVVEEEKKKLNTSINQDSNNNNDNNNTKEEKTSTISTTDGDDGLQLVKSVIFQCNSCLFQTDKKSIMNRHSRVHLAQKRKAMEESTPLAAAAAAPTPSTPTTTINNSIDKLNSFSSSSSTTTTTTTDSDNNEDLLSYCKDCDIKFSSTTTYQHHRNNYCQKYKTIEAILPIQSVNKPPLPLSTPTTTTTTTTTTPNQTQIKQQNTTEQSKSLNIMSDSNNNQIKYFNQIKPIMTSSSSSSSTPSPPPGAVQMGDLVYIPVYKVNNNNNNKSNPILPTCSRIPPPPPPVPQKATSRTILNEKLNQFEFEQSFLLKQSYQSAAFAKHQQELIYIKEKELEYLSNLNRRLQTDLKLTSPLHYRLPNFNFTPPPPLPQLLPPPPPPLPLQLPLPYMLPKQQQHKTLFIFIIFFFFFFIIFVSIKFILI